MKGEEGGWVQGHQERPVGGHTAPIVFMYIYGMYSGSLSV